MSGFTKETQDALRADAEKLSAETGEQHTVEFYDDFDDGDCWNCGGEGYVSDCIDGMCIDAESGCDLCTRRCDVCSPKRKAGGA